MTSMDNDFNGRHLQWKTTSMEDNLNGRRWCGGGPGLSGGDEGVGVAVTDINV